MAGDPQTFAELKDSVATWLNRSDLTLKIPEFIAFAERRFNRTLITPDRETRITSVIASPLALPTDFWQMRDVTLLTDPKIRITPAPIGVVNDMYSFNAPGAPQVYAIVGSQLFFGPTPSGADQVAIDYYATIPALSDSITTNWLLTKHPDIYLYGTLVMAEAFLWNDARLPLWRTALDESLDELTEAGNRFRAGATPIRLRNPVSGCI